MAKAKRSVLLVEDTLPLARVYEEYLRLEPYEVRHAATAAAAIEMFDDASPDAVILDLQLPDANGIEVLRHVKASELAAPVVVITAHGSVNVAVEAMREGAADFIVKPFNGERLITTLRNALERTRLVRDVANHLPELDTPSIGSFIGSSLPMQAVYRTIESAASSRATIFVTGESGTGKEVCAEAVHARSPRAERPFVAINCGAIPKDLMESEIFGHVKGAFTGATSDREGAAARADGGTLFLDEICEMPLDLQVKLLRFVQTGAFVKVGGTRMERVDVRFVCATNRDPLTEVEEGRFREDLYYRLHVIPISMPPLRERGDDVLLLAEHFLASFTREEGRHFAGFNREARVLLGNHPWPGNVRQLQNVVRNVVVLNDGHEVTARMIEEALPDRQGQASAPPGRGDIDTFDGEDTASPGRREIRPLAEVERRAIEAALEACERNVPRAAALLQVSPSTIYRKLSRWEEGAGHH